LLTGGIDLKSKFYVLSGSVPANAAPEAIDAAVKAGTLNIVRYGQFINDIINFLIVAFVVFLIVRSVGKYFKFMEAAPAPPTPSEILLAEIRDLLKSKPGV
jgi:large conductance mechanosensitive channel